MDRIMSCFAMLLALGALACGTDAGRPGFDLEAYQQGRVQFPDGEWPAADPAALGWDVDRLAAARELWESLDSATFLVVHRGVPVVSWGKVHKRYNAQSMRKSLLGALIGTEVDRGGLRLEATLEELGIDDGPPSLSASEKTAQVRDLMHTSSGIYHSALYEHGSWKRRKPERGVHPPGTHWHYNNWDFNALGTIFERASGVRIGPAFEERIARPLQMEDFRARDVVYLTRRSLTERIVKNDSEHAAYVFMVSARDLARFGLMFQEEGRWRGEQVVSSEWVRRSWQDAVGIGEYEDWYGNGARYGLLWWVLRGEQYGAPADTTAYVAQGARGHQLVVIPALELVFAHQVATGGVGLLPQLKRRFLGSGSVDDQDVERLVAAVLEARPLP